MLIHSTTGLLHLLSAFVALITATFVLFARKGNRAHKRWGYVYVASMLVLNGTALGIYSLLGYWGPFHYAALISLAAVFTGFLPAIFRRPGWKRVHVVGMYYSAMGLYAALLSELVTRLRIGNFWVMVAGGTALVMVLGSIVYSRKRQKWIGGTDGRVARWPASRTAG